jgi:hypothetical protein
VRTRYDGALRVAVRMPCDTSKLATSPDLPGSIYEAGEDLFGEAERDALLAALDMSLQPEWGPQPPVLHTGLDLVRYNRIEGLSVGGTATSVLGMGYTAQLLGRIGLADVVPNAELSLARSNGRSTLRGAVFHRLGVANDDWGSPLSFGASLASLLYARDEGFYYRTWGAELSSAREVAPLGGALVTWRLFGERHYSAGRAPETQFSLGNVIGDSRFIDNIDAQRALVGGGALGVQRTFGSNPGGLRLATSTRAEAAAGDFDYVRGLLDATLSRPLGPVAVAVTGSAGTSGGGLPVQRQFYIGGLQTVRGQLASPTAPGQVGNSFWLARAELGTSTVAARPVVFFDMGWAGPRDLWTTPGRPLSGAGVGLSFLDGLVRTDLARGIYPQKKIRFDMYVEARF